MVSLLSTPQGQQMFAGVQKSVDDALTNVLTGKVSDSWRSFQNRFVNLARSSRALEMVPSQAKNALVDQKVKLRKSVAPLFAGFYYPLGKGLLWLLGATMGD
jgi:hypothetical protein